MKFKKSILLLILSSSISLAYISPPKFQTKSVWSINADKFMESGKYYFMCKENNGFLIRKNKPKLNLSKNININVTFGNNTKEIMDILKSIDKNEIKYKYTNISDLTNEIHSDIYTYKINSNKYLLLSDQIDENRIRISLLNYNPDRDVFKTYDELVKKAHSSCNQNI